VSLQRGTNKNTVVKAKIVPGTFYHGYSYGPFEVYCTLEPSHSPSAMTTVDVGGYWYIQYIPSKTEKRSRRNQYTYLKACTANAQPTRTLVILHYNSPYYSRQRDCFTCLKGCMRHCPSDLFSAFRSIYAPRILSEASTGIRFFSK